MTDYTDLIAWHKNELKHIAAALATEKPARSRSRWEQRRRYHERTVQALEAQGRELAVRDAEREALLVAHNDIEARLADAQERLNIRADKIMAAEARLAEAEALIEYLDQCEGCEGWGIDLRQRIDAFLGRDKLNELNLPDSAISALEEET